LVIRFALLRGAAARRADVCPSACASPSFTEAEADFSAVVFDAPFTAAPLRVLSVLAAVLAAALTADAVLV
jgi:hypothetical protein